MPDVASAPPVAGPGFFVSPDHALQVVALNSVAGVTLRVSGTILDGDNCLREFSFDQAPTSDRVANTTKAKVTPGWLITAQVVAVAGTPPAGRCYARLQIIRGFEQATLVDGTIAAGYVTDRDAIVYPGSTLRSSVQDRGALRSITGTDPAANVEVSETVPTGARWRVLAFLVTLVTDATVANREPALTFDDGANVYARTPIGQAITASLTTRVQWGANLTRFTIVADRTIPAATPDLILSAGSHIKTVTANLAATDNYGAPQYLVEEWMEG